MKPYTDKAIEGIVFFFLTLMLAGGIVLIPAVPVQAEETIVTDFYDQGSAKANRISLNYIMEGDEKKTIDIKEDIKIDTYLRPGSNTTINAGKHTITITGSTKGAILNDPDKTDYKAIKNLTINGGIWKVRKNSSKPQTIMRLAHGTNLVFKNVTIEDGYNDHAIELIACKDVVVKGCTLKAKGKCSSTCVEEQLQIDLADRYTAPGIYKLGKKYCNGAPCRNVTVEDCTISGARGICCNFAAKNSANRKADNYHRKITVKNCILTGKSSEALVFFNTISLKAEGNKVTTKAPLSRGAYSIGLHVAYMDGTAPKGDKSNKIIIRKNTVKGGRQAIQVYSHNSQKFGTVTLKGNKMYAKSGKDNALKIVKAQVLKLKKSGNKTRKW